MINRSCCWLQIIFILLLLSPGTKSQVSRVDFLKNNINHASNETDSLSALLAFCTQWDSYSPDTLYKYASQAKLLAAKQKNYKAELLARYYIAAYLYQQNKLDSAQKMSGDVFTGYTKAYPYDSVYVLLYRLTTNIYLRTEQYDSAQAKDLELMKLAEQHKDTLGLAIGTMGLGNVNNKLQKKEDALFWYYKAMALMDNDMFKRKLPFIYNNIAIVYYKLAKEDSMFYFIRQGLKYSEESGNITDYANALFLYGGMLAEFNKTAEAEIAFKKAIEQRKKIGDIYYLMTDMAQLSLFYINTNQPQKGITLSLEGIAIAEKNHYPVLQDLYQALQRSYQLAGDYKNAAKTLEKLLAVKDSVYAKNSEDAMAEMQTKYEVQKKENTIIQQRYDLTKKNFFIYGITGLLAATLLFGYFFFQYRKKNQRLKLQALEMEEKKKITSAVMKAEEDERKRIAADLHDSVAQKMVVAKLNLEVLGNQTIAMSGVQQNIYQNIYNLLDESATEVRNLSHSMMPQAFARSGFVRGLEDCFEKMKRPGFTICFTADGDFSALPENTSLMIYRIIQESAQNVLKHAKATRLDVSLIAEDNELEVMIEDNGVGFDMQSLDIAAATGIKNIRSRIEYLNGKLDMNSQPGKGTVTAFYIPLVL